VIIRQNGKHVTFPYPAWRHPMRTIALFLLLLLASSVTSQQRFQNAKEIADMKARVEAMKAPPGQLIVDNLKVGAKGLTNFLDLQILSVVDDSTLLVQLKEARIANGPTATALVKCKTAGLTDDKFISGGQWPSVLGLKEFVVSGTSRHNGRTILVLEAAGKAGNPIAAKPVNIDITGEWSDGTENNITLNIKQKDDGHVTGSCKYQGKDGVVNWTFTGALSDQGVLQIKLTYFKPAGYEPQVRVGIVSADGTTITGVARFGNNAQDFVWKRLSESKK